jgi:hypothetical protein
VTPTDGVGRSVVSAKTLASVVVKVAAHECERTAG